MGKAYGFVETNGVVGAVDALDIMCKTADVRFVTCEKSTGGRLVTVIVEGSVSAVTEAVEAAMKNSAVEPLCHAVMANPHEEIVKIVEQSGRRFRPEGEDRWQK